MIHTPTREVLAQIRMLKMEEKSRFLHHHHRIAMLAHPKLHVKIRMTKVTILRHANAQDLHALHLQVIPAILEWVTLHRPSETQWTM